MEKYYHLNTAAEEEDSGAFVDNSYYYSYYFDSSSPSGFSSLQSISEHKPLVLDNPYQTSTTPLISSDSHLKRRSSITNSTTLKIPKTESNNVDQPPPPLFQLPNLRSLESESAAHRKRELGRERRQRIRERIERLKELVPLSCKKKRTDSATVLENAGKYIKYLEAQVKVLEGMEVEDSTGMDRNSVLQMMVKSEEIQGQLSSQGMCVYSVEQLLQLQMIPRRSSFYH